MSRTILSVSDLHAYYGDGHALQGVSFEIGQECLAVLGRNGMGKTTLLRALMGLSPPRRRGTVRFLDEDISLAASHTIARAGMAHVPQGRRLFPSLSVLEHLQIAHRGGRSGNGWTPARVFDLFPELARRRRVSGTRLSGGEQQMLAIGRALVTNPRMLLMDEPSEGLAPVVVERVLASARELLASGIAILLVEQNFRAAQLLADRVIVMVTGRIAHTAPMSEFAADTAAQHRHLAV